MVSLNFLESKLLPDQSTIRGNINRLTDNVFSFTVYNLLPHNDIELDGHYTFYVNVDNFEYCLYQSSYYGSLTYTTESKNIDFIVNLNEATMKYVESIIAIKLLGSYFYNRNSQFSKGANLIADCDYKDSLICDKRGYIWTDGVDKKSAKDIEAIKLIDLNYVELGDIEIKYLSRTYFGYEAYQYGKTYCWIFELEINQKKTQLIVYKDNTLTLNNGCKLIDMDTHIEYAYEYGSSYNFKKYVKSIGDFYKSRFN